MHIYPWLKYFVMPKYNFQKCKEHDSHKYKMNTCQNYFNPLKSKPPEWCTDEEENFMNISLHYQ